MSVILQELKEMYREPRRNVRSRRTPPGAELQAADSLSRNTRNRQQEKHLEAGKKKRKRHFRVRVRKEEKGLKGRR